MAYIHSLDFARQQDRIDPLGPFREQFFWPNLHRDKTLYFTGHSLGLQPKTVGERVKSELDHWAAHGVEGHFRGQTPWLDYHQALTPSMARLVGGQPSEVVCMNSLTTNLHLLFVSFYRPTARRFKILAEANMFPSDRYLLETQVKFHGHDPKEAIVEVPPRAAQGLIDPQDILQKIEQLDDELALVFFGGVNYLTGQLFDIQALSDAAHAVGAVAGFDLAHAAGNVPLKLHDWDADFAAWCSYKYLNAGPGNVGAVFVHSRHGECFDLPRFGGWWGHDRERRFLMEPGFSPMPGAEGWQLSNAPVLGMAALRASLEIFDRAEMSPLRSKSEALTGYLEFQLQRLSDDYPDAKIQQVTSTDPGQRGCQLSFNIAGRGRNFFDRMMAAGVIADFREPHMIRLAPVPLYNSFEDVFDFGEAMAALLAES